MAMAMELTKAYPQSKFAADNALTNADVLQKYKIAADVVNVILPELVSRVLVGTSVCDLCQFGDDLINAQVAHLDSSKEKGIAMPTCVSVNNLVQYFSPLYDSDYILQAGDVVKIELGAHFDGYVATAAHTTVVPLSPTEPLQGRAADVICATYFAHEAAQRMLRPGVKSSEITRVINEIAAYFRCKPVEGTFSSPMKRFVLRAGKDIENQFPEGLTVQELEKCDFEIEANQVYQMNIVLTTGDGSVKVSEHKPHVYQRDVNKSYQLKVKAARIAYNEINEKFTVFPFATRALSTNQARLGLASVLSHNLITSYIPTRSSKASDIVAQYKSTVLVSADGVLRTTTPMKPPFVHSQYCVPAGTMAANILGAPSNITINETTEPLKADSVSFGSRRLLNEDTEMDADMA